MIMYFLAMSIKKNFVIICIILYAVDQASSLRCYQCFDISLIGDPTGDCFVNPKKTEFEVFCPAMSVEAFTSSFSKFNSSAVMPSASAVGDRKTPYASNDNDCLTMYYTIVGGGAKTVIRGCGLKSKSDKEIKDGAINAAATKGATISIDALYRCHTDLCNSSGTLSAGLLSLVCSLTLLFFTKLYIQ